MTTKKPKAKIAPTPIFCLSFIWSRDTIVMGRQMMMTSVKMLTGSFSARATCAMQVQLNVQKMVIQ